MSTDKNMSYLQSVLMPKNYRDELLWMMLENPDLPILPLVDIEAEPGVEYVYDLKHNISAGTVGMPHIRYVQVNKGFWTFSDTPVEGMMKCIILCFGSSEDKE